jgi:hypothetical protein
MAVGKFSIPREMTSCTVPQVVREILFILGRGGSGYDPSPCDRVPSLLALTPCSLDNFDCRFLARSNHIRVGQRNPALDYSRHE